MKVAVIGAGSWGTALALKSVDAGHDTWLYCRQEDKASHMREVRENTEYLPGISLPTSLQISSALEEVVAGAHIILLVTPSKFARAAAQSLVPYVNESMIVVGCSKGLEKETGKPLSEVLEEVLASSVKGLAILSGPNHAEEIGRHLPAATVVASTHKEVAQEVQRAFSSDTFRVYVNSDVVGVELGGTTKNIVALAAGITDGMALGDNVKAALLTRGLHEMTRFGIALGAKRETYAGLAGMGDLIATCMSQHSRNRWAGQKLAQGETMEDILSHSNMVVEGFYAVQTVHELAVQLGVDMPITRALYEVLYHGKSPKEVLEELMTRHAKDETWMDDGVQ